jgi:hypothetical protein
MMNSAKIIPFPVKADHDAAPTSVTFRAPFLLPGLDRPHPAGTYELRETREALDVSWAAFVRSLTLILQDGGTTQALDVTRADLDDALRKDMARKG